MAKSQVVLQTFIEFFDSDLIMLHKYRANCAENWRFSEFYLFGNYFQVIRRSNLGLINNLVKSIARKSQTKETLRHLKEFLWVSWRITEKNMIIERLAFGIIQQTLLWSSEFFIAATIKNLLCSIIRRNLKWHWTSVACYFIRTQYFLQTN